MKLFGCIDVNMIKEMHEATYSQMIKEISEDPEFKPVETGSSSKAKFLGGMNG